nr:MBL fold metallo-hydrolase [Oceanipulchritudo coccoides]
MTDLNAHGGIGANCLLLQFEGLNIIIDAGIHPKKIGREALPRFEKLYGLHIDLIFVTHCHLDHLGALPVIAKDHPNTPIIMSHDTAQFYRRMLQNSCNVMDRQRAELGIADYPLYSYGDISACSRQVIGLTPGQARHFEADSGDRISFTLHPSGHIPGAMGILFEYRHQRIFHSGDVLFEKTILLDGAEFPQGDMDTVILETTRGSTERAASRESEIERLLRCIMDTVSHGGSILIPVFALGRMQELLAVFHHARSTGKLKELPIYISGLGIDLLNQFDRISRKSPHVRIRRKILRELNACKMPDKHRPGKDRPGIYLLSSGMMVENTPSYKAASTLLESHQNTIAFVGYCDPDTPGGKILKLHQGDKFLFKSLGKAVAAMARIEKFDLSSHADREELLEFAKARNPRCVVLHHGDPDSRDWFKSRLTEWDPKCQILDPVPLKAVTV